MFLIRKRWIVVTLVSLITSLLFYFCVSFPLFPVSYSTVVLDENGALLGARIAKDGQWRFPSGDSIPFKFEKSLLAFEDKNFYNHIGIDFLAIGNAIIQNFSSGKVVRGASTITMQVVRLSGDPGDRNIFRKVKESIQAVRLELSNSKSSILNLYASHAPFGGNVVGLEAASWRYFGRSPEKLSWAESATLAVLPNSPSLIFPGKNQARLKEKRNRLLKKLFLNGSITELQYELAQQEAIPQRPFPLPSESPHFIEFLIKKGYEQKKIHTTLRSNLQKKVNEILMRHHTRLSDDKIYNAAALVLEVETGNVISYAGNIANGEGQHGYDVDVIQAERSTGSILKPILYALILQKGKYLPGSLVADIPTLIGGYAPKNYFPTYDGAVSLKQSVSRSLNVPAVRLLQEYGIEKFHHNLKQLGLSTLHHPAGHYGLSLILGGAEAKLWDLAGMYQQLAKSLNHFPFSPLVQAEISPGGPNYLKHNTHKPIQKSSPLDASSVYYMMQAMNDVSRPEEESNWKDFASSYKIAWKTGTSYGYRDGWAIGCTPQYVVAVWVGNGSGEGRPALTGVSSAAPIMFDIFKNLKSAKWFRPPHTLLSKQQVCLKSGYRKSEFCEAAEEQFVHWNGKECMPCPYHKQILVDNAGRYRVSPECAEADNRILKNWFILPPAMEQYYRRKNSMYITPPEFRSDCASILHDRSMEILYPVHNSKIFVPVQLDEKRGKTIFEVVHRKADSKVFWYMDNDYLGITKDYHQMEIYASAGSHKLTVVDERGERHQSWFSIVEQEVR